MHQRHSRQQQAHSFSLFLLTQQTKLKSFEAMDEEEKVEWSRLPDELWPKIGKSLENHIDILRFRSACETWRSSIPSSHPRAPSFPLAVPHPLNPTGPHLVVSRTIEIYLNQATIYRVEPSDASSNSKLEPFAPVSSSKGWLIKVIGSKEQQQPLQLVSPISDRKINTAPMVWNLMDYRVFEIYKSYSIEHTGRFTACVQKVVFFPSSSWIDVENSVACCIYLEGKLGIRNHGDNKWTLVDDKNFYYDDVIVYKGQFYVTDRWGTISWVDISSLKLIQFSPPLCGFGNKKHLVESCGSLYVVDRYYESEPRRRNYHVGPPYGDAAVECFKVYRLDEEWGTWVDVKNLGDRAFILGNTCSFSVSAKELHGYQENCIYFTDMFDVRMYNLGNHSFFTIDTDPCLGKSVNKWPHPSWIRIGYQSHNN